MKQTTGIRSVYFLITLFMLFLSGYAAFGQVQIRGTIIYGKDESPAAFASVELQDQKEGSLSDRSGNFLLQVSKLKHDDTLVISSVGYETLKVPVAIAMKRSRFVLVAKSANMENVTVKAFSSKDEVGSRSESVGYFRSWGYEEKGKEIGRIFSVPYKEYKIDKIRFKVSNLCDTCALRLHIREMVNGRPGNEILKDSIGLTISKLTLDDKAPEFDISAYDLTFTQSELFVGIEVMNCKSKTPGRCTFCFAGTEKGKYLAGSWKDDEWRVTDDYTIHLKIFLRY